VLSTSRRAGVIVALALVAGGASFAVQPTAHAAALPSASALIHGTDWRVASTGTVVAFTGEMYNSWGVYNPHVGQASLFVAVASVQKVVHWSGELGYEGAGYLTQSRRIDTLTLSDGAHAPATFAVVKHLTDRELVAYAVVSADRIEAHGLNDIVRTGWETLIGTKSPYYLVSVSVPDPTSAYDAQAGRIATSLLTPVLQGLRADARAVADTRQSQ